ncbi:MAG: ABC transporter permease [Rhodocyclaceae bacterium]
MVQRIEEFAGDAAEAAAPVSPPAKLHAVPPAPAAMTPRKPPLIAPRTLLTWLLGALSLCMLVTLWHFAVKYRVDFYIRFNNIPAPQAVLEDAMALASNTRFQRHILLSLQRILTGFGIAALIAIPLGLLMGRNRIARELIFPALEVLRPIPAIAWVPMSIMLWPSNEVSIVFITFLGSFFPILLNTIHGVQALDKVLVRAARCLGAGQLALFWHVVLPGSLPHVFTGLTIGMGVAWVSLIAAEMISGQFGIGYFTWEAYSLVRYSEIVLGMIVIGVLGLFCSGLIRLIGTWVMPWAHRAQMEND